MGPDQNLVSSGKYLVSIGDFGDCWPGFWPNVILDNFGRGRGLKEKITEITVFDQQFFQG